MRDLPSAPVADAEGATSPRRPGPNQPEAGRCPKPGGRLLLPRHGAALRRIGLRAVGLVTSPILLLLALIAALSLGGRGSNDCPGYTAVAVKAGRGAGA